MAKAQGTLIEEWNERGERWWTLIVGSLRSPQISVSYPKLEDALEDAPNWCDAKRITMEPVTMEAALVWRPEWLTQE